MDEEMTPVSVSKNHTKDLDQMLVEVLACLMELRETERVTALDVDHMTTHSGGVVEKRHSGVGRQNLKLHEHWRLKAAV